MFFFQGCAGVGCKLEIGVLVCLFPFSFRGGLGWTWGGHGLLYTFTGGLGGKGGVEGKSGDRGGGGRSEKKKEQAETEKRREGDRDEAASSNAGMSA